MKRSKQTIRKPDPLMLLTVLVAVGVLVTTGVDAGERFNFRNLDFTSMLDGDVSVAQMGHSGAGVYLSVEDTTRTEHLLPASQMSTREHNDMPGVYLSVRMPW